MAQVKLICLVKAKPGQTREEFQKRWLEGHSPFAASWKNIVAYRINFPDPEVQEFKGEGALYDGIGELVWNSKEEMEEDMNSERGQAGFADGAEFMDAYVNMYCVEHIIK